MDMLSKILLIFVVTSISIVETNARRNKWKHVVYLDPYVNPKFRSKTLTYDVEIGQFMDILCPQTNLGITEYPTDPLTFDIFNVTEDGYRTCDNADGKLIFVCDRPSQENKLTIKFQEISPSPYGFRFQYCEDYYFIATPRNSNHKSGRKGCNKETMRMKLKVGCKATTTKKTTTTTEKPTKTPKTTTTKKPIKTYLEKVKEDAIKKREEKNEKVIPDLVTVTQSTKFVKDRAVSASQQIAGSSAQHASFSTSIILLLVTLNIFLQRFVSP